LEEPPDADAVAVVAPAVDAVALRLVGRRDGGALADAEAERLDVDGHVDGEAPAPRPRVVGARPDARVAIAAVVGEHGSVHAAAAPSRVRLAQLELLELASGGADERIADLDRRGALVMREPGPAVGDQIMLGGGGPGPQHHERLDRLAPLLVGDADHRDLEDG